jgi:hypothetical protein
MKKISLFSLVIASSFLFSACTLPFASKSSLPSESDTPEVQAQKMSQLIASGASAKCQITDNNNPEFVTEIIFSGEKMKMTGTQVAQGSTGSFINDGEYTYVWQEGQTTGYKTKNVDPEDVDNMEEASPDYESGDVEQAPDFSQYENNPTYKIDCQEINISADEFTPPADVQFIDPSEMNFSDLSNFNFGEE